MRSTRRSTYTSDELRLGPIVVVAERRAGNARAKERLIVNATHMEIDALENGRVQAKTVRCIHIRPLETV